MLFAAVAGCSAPIQLSILSQAGHAYREQFTQAYVSHDVAGNEMVLLVRDPLEIARPASAGEPLSPSPAASLRQVVQIQLLYRPMSGARGDSPAATNAVVHWFVYSSDAAAGSSMIQYTGTAFAAIDVSGHSADVIIRTGQASESERHGDLVDPLHAFTIEGRFDAAVDDAKVKEILDEVHQAAGAVAAP